MIDGFRDGNLKDLLESRFIVDCRSKTRSVQMHSSLIQRLRQEKELEGHQGCVNAISWNSKGSLLLSGSDKTWVEDGNPNVIWSASEDGTLRQHDLREGNSCPLPGLLSKNVEMFWTRMAPPPCVNYFSPMHLSEHPEAAIDVKQRYVGHCNVGTDIKQANFLGQRGEYIASGSDDGRWFVWEKRTGRLVKILFGDEAIVNCVQCCSFDCVVATSGIDNTIKIWTPTAPAPSMVAVPDGHCVCVDDAIDSNRRRLTSNREIILPFEILKRFRMQPSRRKPAPFRMRAKLKQGQSLV